MDNRPIKGNSSGKYNLNFIDPTNDICAYYNGMTELEELVVIFCCYLGKLSRDYNLSYIQTSELRKG